MWPAFDLIIVGFGLIVLGYIVYINLFAELSRRRHKRPLTAELLNIYLFSYTAAAGVIFFMRPMLEQTQLDMGISLPPAVLQGMNLVWIFCGVTSIIALAACFIVLLRHRASATSR